MAVVEVLNRFAGFSGLTANPAKTDIYLGGVKAEVKRQILLESHFSEGVFPFRYLGIPLASVNLRSDMYNHLLDKVRKHITNWANQSLSYAGRVQLINSMLFGLENFWCAAVLLPKGVVKRLIKDCKDFLWQIEDGRRKITFKSLRDICLPKDEGGFGIKELLSWNKAVICRHLYDLEHEKSSVWLNWLRSYKLGRKDLWAVTSTSSDAEGWSDILCVRDMLLSEAGGISSAKDLLLEWGGCVAKAYDFFMYKSILVKWAPLVWGSVNVPKHCYIAALAFQGKLATVDNLCSRGMSFVNWCILCKVACESHDHWFFACSVTQAILQQIFCWIGICRRVRSLRYEMRSCVHMSKGRHWKAHWISCSLVATIYHVWMERNRRIFSEISTSVDCIVRQIKRDVSIRLVNLSRACDEMAIVHALNG